MPSNQFKQHIHNLILEGVHPANHKKYSLQTTVRSKVISHFDLEPEIH